MFNIDSQASKINKSLTILVKNQTILNNNIALKDLLIKEEKYWKGIKAPNTFHVRFQNSLEIVQLLAATGQLYHGEHKLVCDFFSPSSVHLIISSKNEVRCQVKTRLQTFFLDECDFICPGPPEWLIKGYLLRMLNTELPWPVLSKAYNTPLFTILQEELCEYDPSILFDADEMPYQFQEASPLPILKLTDHTGAFAHLLLEYPGKKIIPFHDTKSSSFRNLKTEKLWEADLLETGFTKKWLLNSNYYCPLDQVGKSLSFLLDLGWKIYDTQDREVLKFTSAALKLENGNEHILIKGKVCFSDYQAEASQVMQNFNRKERFINLSENHIGLLPDNWSGTPLEELEESEWVADSIAIKKQNFGTLENLLYQEKNIGKDIIKSADQNCAPSSDFVGKLRPYQTEGLKWLSFLHSNQFAGLLADDMGLGKTVQILAFLSTLDSSFLHLIVVPTSLLFNWESEIKRFLPNSPLKIHYGPERAKSVEELMTSSGIILTTYNTARLDLAFLNKCHFHCLILDEAQTIKNAKTQVAQALFNFQANFRVSITGTPVENHLEELWSHFRLLLPTLLGSLSTFQAEIKAGSSDIRFLNRLKKKIKPFILRRQKEDVAKDLPEKIEQFILLDMSDDQRKIYNEFLSSARSGVLKKVKQDGLGKHRMEVLETILRLKQICCHPLLCQTTLSDATSSKMDLLKEDLLQLKEEGKKALIYSQFTSLLKLIGKELHQQGINFSYLDGQTKDRAQAVKLFQEDLSCSFFLISLKAGGVGLNLTAADYVFLYDPWWNEAAEEQAINRAHRIGRQHTVIAKRYIMKESVEEKILHIKQRKKQLATALINTSSEIVDFSEDELISLLE